MITRREDAIGLEAAAWDMAEEYFGAPPNVLKRITAHRSKHFPVDTLYSFRL